MRTTPAIRVALEEAADRGGRSLAQEIEQRLERSVAADREAGSPATAAFLASINADIADIEAATGKGWTADIATYGAVRHAIAEAVADLMPTPAEYADALRQAIVDMRALGKVAHLADDARNATLPAGMVLDADKVAALQAEMEAETMGRVDALRADLENKAAAGITIFEEIRTSREQMAQLRRSA
ncbi:hypothetical protein [Sphingomonas sp. PAMC 26617]|uniref:hypothetical protein n=1 Tax=Sphingomonas sp. PAMC 26617 TaxID=1112216 RepID=UPI000287E10E|nr:hypothetical protein [Sphingomonas sp. PAMC 26617]